MEASVKSSIDSRKSSFEMSYELTDEVKKDIDELFSRIEEFGNSCKDAMDFEAKFASSPLNQEYIDMFTKVAKKCKVKGLEDDGDSKGKRILKEAGSDAKYLADDLTMPARRQARMKFDQKMRNTPLGKVEQANNTLWLFKRLKHKVSKKDDISENEGSEN